MQMTSTSFPLYPHLPIVVLSKMPSTRFLYVVSNGIQLCLDKGCVISFGRSHRIVHNYTLCDIPISRVISVKDLGMWLDETLPFNVHIEHVLNKANKTPGLIVRLSSGIRDPNCL